jgi:hypothetical protein
VAGGCANDENLTLSASWFVLYLFILCVCVGGGGGWQAHQAQGREGGVSWGGGDRVFAKTRAEGSQQQPEVAGVRSLCSGLHSLLFLVVLPLTGVGWLGGGARAEGSQQHPEEWQVGGCKCSEPAHLYCTYFFWLSVLAVVCVWGWGWGVGGLTGASATSEGGGGVS